MGLMFDINKVYELTEIPSSSFDVSYALSSMYLWLIFGFLSTLINCDLQKVIQKDTKVAYFGAFISLFFLFTIVDPNNKLPLYIIWGKTVLVFIVFIMLTKSKYYFSIPVISILLIMQSISYHIRYLEGKNKDVDTSRYITINRYLNIAVIMIIIIGFIHYLNIRKNKDKPILSVILNKCNI